MPSMTSARVSARARRASASPPAHVLARTGLAARGVIYLLIGWVAILVALGKTAQEADQRGALQLLSGKPYGLVSLWLLCIGFAAYALWRLLTNKLKAVVATSALGMGYDKPDLGFIVHLGAPQSPVAYYQQIGRAGRGVDRAEVILLPATEDRDIWAYFASLAFPPERMVRVTLGVLARASGPLSLAALEAHVDLGRGRLETMLKVLDVDGAVRRVSRGWEATGRPWAYDTERYERVAAERAREQQAMLAYMATSNCRMDYLRRELDDPAAAPCGRCDNCTGTARTTRVSQASEDTARTRLQRPGVTLQPRRMWPAGMAELGVAATGRISAEEAAEPGRSIGRLTDIGWGVKLRQLLADGAPDQAVPDNLFNAVLQVLAAWTGTSARSRSSRCRRAPGPT